MSKTMDKTITSKIDNELYQFYKEEADERGLSMSEWVKRACECYFHWLSDVIDDYEETEDLTMEDLNDMGWDELIDVIDENELDIDSKEYRDFFSKDTDALRDAIADELGLPEYTDEDTDEDTDEHTDEDTDEPGEK